MTFETWHQETGITTSQETDTILTAKPVTETRKCQKVWFGSWIGFTNRVVSFMLSPLIVKRYRVSNWRRKQFVSLIRLSIVVLFLEMCVTDKTRVVSLIEHTIPLKESGKVSYKKDLEHFFMNEKKWRQLIELSTVTKSGPKKVSKKRSKGVQM